MHASRLSLFLAAALLLGGCRTAAAQCDKVAGAPTGMVRGELADSLDRLPSTAPAELDRPVVRGELGATLDEYLSRLVPYGFSGAILVAKEGEILLHKGYGWADREQRIPVGTNTVFDIASVVKPFTAAAVLRLEAEGRLSVDNSIAEFFDNVPVEKRGITIHHLLTHTAGLPLYSGDDFELISRDAFVRRALDAQLRWPVGSRYGYSNVGYSLLAAIIEEVTGQPYEHYVHDAIFCPARMQRTGYVIPGWVAEHVAHGYAGDRDQGTLLDQPWLPDGPGWNLRGNGGMLGSVADLYRFHQALQQDAVLPAPVHRKMEEGRVPAPGAIPRHSLVTYGWYTSTAPQGARRVTKAGTSGWGYVDVQRFPDEDIVVIVAMNQADAMWMRLHGLERRILDAILTGAPPPLAPIAASGDSSRSLGRYAGTYRLSPHAMLEVVPEGDHLVVRPIGQEAVNLVVGADVGRGEDRHRFSAIADTIIRESRAGRSRILRRVATPNALERLSEQLRGMWGDLREITDEAPAVRVVGTLPAWWLEDPSTLATIVRVDLPEGPEFFAAVWDGNRLHAITFFLVPPEVPLTVRSATEFIGYHPVYEYPMQVQFTIAKDGATAGMVVQDAEAPFAPKMYE